MISPSFFCRILQDGGIQSYVGVPDSLLKNLCSYISENEDIQSHTIAANEGCAIAIATGQFLASGSPSAVYLQNSGLGNIVNPLLSLADPEVYSIPMLLLIGWRGEPGSRDEPQHMKQGRVTTKLLDTLGVSWYELGASTTDIRLTITDALREMRERQAPVALVIRKNTFSEYNGKAQENNEFELSREEAIKLVIDTLPDDFRYVCTTGMTSREVFEYRKARGETHSKDFLTVGSMGHASSIAYGICSIAKDARITCLDGDGAMIMHMGAITAQAKQKSHGFLHVLINNGAHDSVGGQPTVGLEIDFCKIAIASGYKTAVRVASEQELVRELSVSTSLGTGPNLIEVYVRKGSRKDLGRPTLSPIENRVSFMEGLRNSIS